MSTFTAGSSGEKFSLLAAVERTSGIFGPLIWALPFILFIDTRAYIVAMVLMAALTFFAFLLLLKNRPGNISSQEK
jgi:MFS-type transporter involved in bile tolerance (Atg22 family)